MEGRERIDLLWIVYREERLFTMCLFTSSTLLLQPNMRRRETAARDSTSSTPMPTSGLGAQSGMSQLSLSRPNLTQTRPPKFDNIEAHFGMWRSKFMACLSSLGCLYVLKATDNPVMVGDMNVSQEELEQKHSPQVIRDARLVYGLLMESMTGYAFAEFRMQQAKSPSGAWQELENYYMPRTLAATHRLKREFEAIHMQEGEDPLVFLGRVDKAADELAMLGCAKSVEEVNRHIVNNLSSLYTIQSKSILSRPSIPRSEIDEIIRDAYMNDKVCLLYTSPSPRDLSTSRMPSSA